MVRSPQALRCSKGQNALHTLNPPASPYAIMRRACPYRGENNGPGKDIHRELDPTPGIREQPGSFSTLPVEPTSLSISASARSRPGWCDATVRRFMPTTAASRSSNSPLHSTTSSASASSVGGTVRPSALAAFKFMIISYLVGNSTGRSAGLSPLRMRAT